MPVPWDFIYGPVHHNNSYSPNRNLFYIGTKNQESIIWNDS